MRCPQPLGTKGSLKWLQRAVAHAPDLLQPTGLPTIRWVSPLRGDDFAEYRDAAFLARIGLAHLAPALAEFWPRRGPQWDGLGIFDGGVVLVEAKAHLDEFKSPPSKAGPDSRARIEASLAWAADRMGATAPWGAQYYQYANRLAHLVWLRDQGVGAHLLCVDFLRDAEVGGPATATDWQAAYAAADRCIGLPSKTGFEEAIHHVYPDTHRLDRPA